MAILDAEKLPAGREHLAEDELKGLGRFEACLAAGDYRGAQDEAEDLWLVATDAHKRFYQGLSNALTAICARELGHLRGAREIAARTHEILAPYPRRALGLDLTVLLESMDGFVADGTEPVRWCPET